MGEILDIKVVHMVKEERGGCGFSNHEEKKKIEQWMKEG